MGDNEKAYVAMHELRLDYAVGKYDHDAGQMNALNAIPKVNGKHFY